MSSIFYSCFVFSSYFLILPCMWRRTTHTRSSNMLRFTSLLCRLRPRHIMFTPPPLAKRTGKFRCHVCQHCWFSDHVWVTKTTQRVYQGESCEKCGTSAKPYYIGRPEETIFNRTTTPHPVKAGASTSRHERKLKHARYDFRVQKNRR